MEAKRNSTCVWVFDHFLKTRLKEGESGRFESLALSLSDRGVRSVLFVSSTLHPSGQPASFRRFPAVFRTSGLVTWVYVWTPSYGESSGFRAANALVYTLVGLLIGLGWGVLRRSPTHIVGSTMHYGAPIVAAFLAKIFKAKFLYEMRDVWPEIAVDVGRWDENGVLVRLFRAVNRILFQASSAAVSPLPHFKKYLAENKVDRRFLWFPNCVSYNFEPSSNHDLGRLSERGQRPSDGGGAREFLYLGSFGELYDFVGVIRAFEILVSSRPEDNLSLTFLGSGAREEEIRREAYQSSCSAKIRLEVPVPSSLVSSRLRSSSFLLLPYRNLQTLRFGVSPLKLTAYLQSGRPIVFCSSDGGEVLGDLGFAFSAESSDVDDLARVMGSVVALTQQQLALIQAQAERFLSTRLSFQQASKPLVDFIDHFEGP